MLFTQLFSFFIPMGNIISLLGLYLLYRAYKWNIINRCSFGFSLSSKLNTLMIEILEINILFFTFSYSYMDIINNSI